MTHDLLVTVFDSFTPADRSNNPFWDQAGRRALTMLFDLKAMLKPKESITLNDPEQLLLNEPFYQHSCEQAQQKLSARYHAKELNEDKFRTEFTKLHTCRDTWLNEIPKLRATIKVPSQAGC